MSEFDYAGWEHWKSYWRIGVNKEEEEEKEEGEGGEEEEGEEEIEEEGEGEEEKDDDDEWEIEDIQEKRREAGEVAYEDVYIAKLEPAGTALLWDGFEDVTSPCTRFSLEEQLQLQLTMQLDHSPISSPPSSTPSHSPTSSEDDDDDEWRPSAYYLQRSASVSTLAVETHGLELAFKDEHIDPALRCGYSSVQKAREALYPGCGDATYGNGEEGETMRDWPVPSALSCSVQPMGYQSVQEARKALHSYTATGYGVGEEGEPMRDWTSEFNSPGEAGAELLKCRGDAEEGGVPLGSPVETRVAGYEGSWI